MALRNINKTKIVEKNELPYIEFSFDIHDNATNCSLIRISCSRLIFVSNQNKYTPSKEFNTTISIREHQNEKFRRLVGIDKQTAIQNMFGVETQRILLSLEDIEDRLINNSGNSSRFFANKVIESLGGIGEGTLRNYLVNLTRDHGENSDYFLFKREVSNLRDKMKFDETKILIDDILSSYYSKENFENTTRRSQIYIRDIHLPSLDSSDEANNIIISMYDYELDLMDCKLTPKRKLNVSTPKDLEWVLNHNKFYLVNSNNYRRENEDQLSIFDVL